MANFIDIAIAAVLCCAVTVIFIEVRSKLLSPVRSRDGARLFTVIVIEDEAAGLEETVTGLDALHSSGRASSELIIASMGACPSAIRRAERLAEKSGAYICDAGDITKAIKELTWGQTKELT